MDFQYYKLFVFAWNKLHYAKGIDVNTYSDKFLPLFEKLTTEVDTEKGKASTYFFRGVSAMLSDRARYNFRQSGRRYQYIDQHKDDVVESAELSYLNKNFLSTVLRTAPLTSNERELVDYLMFKDPGTSVRQASKNIGKYTASRGDQLYKSALRKIRETALKERNR